MAAAAVALAARGAYRSAGTVEFLVNAASSAFYFLEVNTRIQVEAGVTEAVTGVDLVAGMLRLARGDPASDWFPALASAAVADGADPPTADGPVTTVPTAGAAVEARVYAESPLHGYRPSPGTLTAMVWPPPSPTLRVDTWASTGCTVSGAFDPLLGKLIASGPTRAAALATLADALSATVVRGVASNLELLSAVVANEAFAAGEYTTALLDGVMPKACAVEVLAPGVQSSLQDHPGRVGLWRVGVSPSGALDAHAMVAANGLLDNEPGAVAMEMTVRGPTLKVHTQTTVVLSGARLTASLDVGPPLPWWTPIPVPAGAVLAIGGLYRPAAAAAAAADAAAAAAAAVVWDDDGEGADASTARDGGVAVSGATAPAIGAAVTCLNPAAVGATPLGGAPPPGCGGSRHEDDGGDVEGGGKVAYLAVRGGFDAPPYLGSASTFPIGHFGGHAGTFLAAGDLLPLRPGAAASPTPWGTTPLPRPLRPTYAPASWRVAVLVGPHGSPDIFTPAALAALFTSDYTVQHATNRLGVRLTGPTPDWARPSGGDAGLHPSNMHDYPYAVGAVNYSGNTPIVLMADGPSLGGFVCPLTVAGADLWKVAAARPGDTLRWVPVSAGAAAAAAAAQRRTWTAIRAGPAAVAALGGPHTAAATADGGGGGGWWDPDWVEAAEPSTGPAVLATLTTATATAGEVAITLRSSGDTHVLVEVGACELDLLYRFLVYELAAALDGGDGIGELCPGVRSLLVEFEPSTAPLPAVVARVAELAVDLGARLAAGAASVRSRVVHLPLAFGDRWTAAELTRYARSVRVEFVRRINGLPSVDAVREVLTSAEYLVLGLGDVYLGAPCAVPVDPRHRLVTSKFNPARTHTPEGAVGIGGAYMCIYGTESPGGYQLVGRTLPIWDTYGRVPEAARGAPAGVPWLLRFFDRVKLYPVSDAELVDARRRYARGDLPLRIEDGPGAVFSYAVHARFLKAQAPSIAAFVGKQRAAYEAEATRWAAEGEGANNDAGAAATGAAGGDGGDGTASGANGDGATAAAASAAAVATASAASADAMPPAPHSVAVVAGVTASMWSLLVPTGTRSPYGVPLNAAAPDYIPGGSSSGSAAAVAARIVPFALGTDTAGSGRVPTAMTGIVGLKPTRGRVSTRGVVPACRSLDVVSVFARSVADADAVLDVLGGYDPADPYSRQPPPSSLPPPSAAAAAAAAAPPATAAAPVDGGRPPPSPSAFPFGVPAAPRLTFNGDDGSAAAYAAAVDAAVRLGGVRVEVNMAPLAAAAKLLLRGPLCRRTGGGGRRLSRRPPVGDGRRQWGRRRL